MTVLTAVSAAQAEHARVEAQAALDAKDALHKELGAAIDREITRVSQAWQRVEVALQTERLTWIVAHGSAALRQQTEEALGAGRVGAHGWRPGVPLEWDQAERLATLQPQMAREWLASNRPGWVTWEQGAAARPELVLGHVPFVGNVPHIARTQPLVELMTAAHAHDESARLYQLIDEHAPRTRFCAMTKVRLPGGYAPVQIALRETPRQARQLDQIGAYLEQPYTEHCGYEENLAMIVEVETERPLAPVPEGEARGVLQRIDIGPLRDDAATEVVRAIVVSEQAAYIVFVDRHALMDAVGKQVRLVRDGDDRVFVEAPNVPVALGYEDIDALQQLQLRRELIGLASMERRDEARGGDARADLLEGVSRRVETRIAACRAIEHGIAMQDMLLDPVPPRVDLARRESALATERLAWMVAHGSPKLLAQSADDIAASIHDEWLRAQPGWRLRAPDERGWRRVAVDGGPNTVHPKLTLRDTAPVKELMVDAWAHAPDAFLAARVNGSDRADKRPVHCAVIARRAPGALQREALIREETMAQTKHLDVEWKVRQRARGAEDRLPHRLPAELGHNQLPQNATEKMTERVQREFGLPGAALPEATPVAGRLARIEQGSDHRHRAVVVSAKYVHVVSVLPTTQLQELVGKHITVEKTAGRVKIARQPQERELAR